MDGAHTAAVKLCNVGTFAVTKSFYVLTDTEWYKHFHGKDDTRGPLREQIRVLTTMETQRQNW